MSNKNFVIPTTLLSCSFGYILAKIDNLFLNYIEKSLRILIETAKFMKVPSYETIAEVSFSRSGFVFVSVNMFILSYGAMVSYLIVSNFPSNYLFDLSFKHILIYDCFISLLYYCRLLRIPYRQ